MKLLNLKKRAFTTMEMIITMIIVVSFMLLTTYMFNNIRNDENYERDFWYSFHNYWNETVTMAKNEHEGLYVRLSANNRKVLFGDLKRKLVLDIPNSMYVTHPFKVSINSDGYIAPCTIIWKSNQRKITYIQTIQLGWGIYQLKEE